MSEVNCLCASPLCSVDRCSLDRGSRRRTLRYEWPEWHVYKLTKSELLSVENNISRLTGLWSFRNRPALRGSARNGWTSDGIATVATAMKILCVAEKPSIAKSISEILAGGQRTAVSQFMCGSKSRADSECRYGLTETLKSSIHSEL
jgi:hypothetical protein